jgi:hypothetical protein
MTRMSKAKTPAAPPAAAATGRSATSAPQAPTGKKAEKPREAPTAQAQTIEWLLAGDPAIRWQVLRDLLHAPAADIERERAKLPRATEGWTARLLAKQDASGGWAGGLSSDDGLYSPKWISTHYTMLLLRDLGLSSDSRPAQKACRLMLDKGLQRDGGVNFDRFGVGISETCITGMTLSILSYFELDDDRLDLIARYLLDQQMDDGGWNCRRRRGATHASVHTTISALEGLRDYELHRCGSAGRASESSRKNSRNNSGSGGRGSGRAVRAAQARGREFLLAHRMFRSHRTGEIIKPVFVKLSFPPRWHYDILRGLDYFQAVRAPYDERLTDAIDTLRGYRDGNGRWPLQQRYGGKVYFEMERLGGASRWNTLRALRVLNWWESVSH